MAFSDAVTVKTVFGNKRVHIGTWSGSGVTTGDLDTGLRKVEALFLNEKDSAVGNAPAINESMPCAGSAVTLVFDSGAAGNWMAIGY